MAQGGGKSPAKQPGGGRAGKSVPQLIEEEGRKLLDGGLNDDETCVVCGHLAMLTSSQPEEAPMQTLKDVLPRLMDLLSGSQQEATLQNAIAALAGSCALDPQLAEAAYNAGLVGRVCALLKENSSIRAIMASDNAPSEAPEASPHAGTRTNLAVLVSSLAQSWPDAGTALLENGAVAAVLDSLDLREDREVVAAACDALCQLCTAEGVRPGLRGAGAVGAAARVLSTDDAELAIRALLAIGMLVGRVKEEQRAALEELAGAPGAVAALVRWMRGADGDCQSVARDLFQGMSAEEGLKEQVLAALRAQEAGTDTFVN
ncbi:unnamed protein product [Pedinophyceae sp. YPF-701]|nr:unnamed protein product [Pedinophyceae sp. YPF-701]